jgi:hypothetical protein
MLIQVRPLSDSPGLCSGVSQGKCTMRRSHGNVVRTSSSTWDQLRRSSFVDTIQQPLVLAKWIENKHISLESEQKYKGKILTSLVLTFDTSGNSRFHCRLLKNSDAVHL